MKKLLIALISLFAVSQSFASYQNRYTTSYQNWDQTFYGYYGYSESRFSNACGAYYTCYAGPYTTNYQAPVYIEETYITDGTYTGFRRITVYQTQTYTSPYVTYYVQNNQIIRRDFYQYHPYIPQRDYYYVNTYQPQFYTELDSIASQLIVGGGLIAAGTILLADDHADGAQIAAGVISVTAGVASSVSASIEAKEKSDLQRRLEAQEAQGNKSDRDI